MRNKGRALRWCVEQAFEQPLQLGGCLVAVVVGEQQSHLSLRVADRAFVPDRGGVAGAPDEVRNDPRLLQYLAP